MSREERARQFAPFEALRGLRKALKLKEFEHERLEKGDLPEEKILEISNFLRDSNKNTPVEVKYFENGQYLTISGTMKVDEETQTITVGHETIDFDCIFDIKNKSGV